MTEAFSVCLVPGPEPIRARRAFGGHLEGGMLETLGELSLAVDDLVVYASHGVGRVAMRRPKSVVVEFANGGLLVTLPIERALECIRSVSTEAEIANIGLTLGGAGSAVEANWQGRLKVATAKVRHGEAVGLAEVIRDASRRDEHASVRGGSGEISLSERQLYLKARRLLADEIGASRGVDASQADEWIGDQIAVNAGRERPPKTGGLLITAPSLEATTASSGNRARRRRH